MFFPPLFCQTTDISIFHLQSSPLLFNIYINSIREPNGLRQIQIRHCFQLIRRLEFTLTNIFQTLYDYQSGLP